MRLDQRSYDARWHSPFVSSATAAASSLLLGGSAGVGARCRAVASAFAGNADASSSRPASSKLTAKRALLPLELTARRASTPLEVRWGAEETRL